jgi:hypothetical protein
MNRQRILIVSIWTLPNVTAPAAEGDVLFYRQGTGQADWAQPVINKSRYK